MRRAMIGCDRSIGGLNMIMRNRMCLGKRDGPAVVRGLAAGNVPIVDVPDDSNASLCTFYGRIPLGDGLLGNSTQHVVGSVGGRIGGLYESCVDKGVDFNRLGRDLKSVFKGGGLVGKSEGAKLRVDVGPAGVNFCIGNTRFGNGSCTFAVGSSTNGCGHGVVVGSPCIIGDTFGVNGDCNVGTDAVSRLSGTLHPIVSRVFGCTRFTVDGSFVGSDAGAGSGAGGCVCHRGNGAVVGVSNGACDCGDCRSFVVDGNLIEAGLTGAGAGRATNG